MADAYELVTDASAKGSEGAIPGGVSLCADKNATHGKLERKRSQVRGIKAGAC